MVYLGDANRLSDLRENTKLFVKKGSAHWELATAKEGEIKYFPGIYSNTDYYESSLPNGNEFNVFARALICVYTTTTFKVVCKLPGYQSAIDSFTFEAVKTSIEFTGASNMQPLSLRPMTNLFPVTYPATPVATSSTTTVISAKMAVKPAASMPKIIDDNGKKFTLNRTNCMFLNLSNFDPMHSFNVWATSEGAGSLLGYFILETEYVQSKVRVPKFGSNQIDSEIFWTVNQLYSRKGDISPAYIICPDMKIDKPTGTPPPAGEAGASDGNNEALFKFDYNKPGKCEAVCHAAGLANLPTEVRSLVWKALEWQLPDVGTVGSGEGVATHDGKVMTFTYDSMPPHNDAFDSVNNSSVGHTNIVLRFKGRPEWSWYQPVQYRFKRTGTSAAAAALAAETLSSDYVIAGNPNWYTYWQQVARQFNHSESQSFGPHCPMVYSNSLYGVSGIATNVVGHYYYTISDKFPYEWYDRITIYRANESDVVEFVKTIHHENGHRQSKQRPNAEGGWGASLTYVPSLDMDRDFICDLFETNGAGMVFSIEDTEEAQNRDKNAWSDRDHLSSGFCTRNENHVTDKSSEIKLKDWSSILE